MLEFIWRGRGASSTTEFERVVGPYFRRVFEVAMLLAGDPDRAADLAQETLVRAFRAFPRFRKGAAVMPWLVTILRNHYRDEQRSARVRREVHLDVDALLEDRPEAAPDPAAVLESQQLRRRLEILLRALPKYYGLPVLLVDVQDLPYAEAAEALQVPIGTLRSRLARGRGLLRRAVLSDRELQGALPRTLGRSEE